jgi:hypothetical protein
MKLPLLRAVRAQSLPRALARELPCAQAGWGVAPFRVVNLQYPHILCFKFICTLSQTTRTVGDKK